MELLRLPVKLPRKEDERILDICKQLGIDPRGTTRYRPGSSREEVRLCERIRDNAESLILLGKTKPEYKAVHDSLQRDVSELLLIRLTAAYSSR